MRELCYRCKHYRQCVAAGTYCPPYGLAVRWRVAFGDAQKNEIVQELLEYKNAGWDVTDFCKICNFRCKPVGQKDLANHWRDFCLAIDVVAEDIPCPVKVKKS
jgi:hypothetical protein